MRKEDEEYDETTCECRGVRGRSVQELSSSSSPLAFARSVLWELRSYVDDHLEQDEPVRPPEVDYAEIVGMSKKPIGKGAFSKVFKAEWRGRVVAVKKLKDQGRDERLNRKFAHEVYHMWQARTHQHCARLYGSGKTKLGKRFIVMEYVGQGSLDRYLHGVVRFAAEAAAAVAYLHMLSIAHRDIAARNVLVTDDGHIKLSDFGLSRPVAHSLGPDNLTETAGNWRWSPPEDFADLDKSLTDSYVSKPGFAISNRGDRWSFGMLLLEIGLGVYSLPFKQIHSVQTLIRLYRIGKTPPIHSYDSRLQEIMRGCLQINPEERWPMAQVYRELRSLADQLREVEEDGFDVIGEHTELGNEGAVSTVNSMPETQDSYTTPSEIYRQGN